VRFAEQGYRMAALPALVAVAALVWAWWAGAAVVAWWTAAVAAGVAAAVLLFFRDPEREDPGGEHVVVSPADGRVVAVAETESGHPLDPGRRRRVSVFMSPLNVHINRIPAAGVVEDISYHQGRFRAAYGEDASEVNEANAILLAATTGYRYVVVQIAGWLARRIVCTVERGQRVGRGERLGLIMFGSRLDLFLPLELTVKVSKGQRVKAGSTVIADKGAPR
jgi:phosphatidylserine decarboxylase